MIVVDASAMVEWLLETPVGLKVEQRALIGSGLCVPHLLDLEVAQALRKLVRAQTISTIRGQQALEDLLDMDIIRYPHDGFLRRIWRLRDTCTAYDAVYIALAESIGAPLLTCDQKLASASGHNVFIELFQAGW